MFKPLPKNELSNSLSSQITPTTAPDPAPKEIKKDEPPPTVEKVLGGSMSVRFGTGLTIISISPISVSSSSIVLENIPPGTPQTEIQSLVHPFKPTISPHSIRMYTRGDNLRVIVHFDDTVAADDAVKGLEGAYFRGRGLSVNALKPTMASQDVTKIECSWFPASASAVLRVGTRDMADDIVDMCTRKDHRIRGRRIKAILQHDRASRLGCPSVLLVNLDPNTEEDEIETLFMKHEMIIAMREPKYRMSDAQTMRYIRVKFEVDRPDDLRVISQPHESRVRSILTYASANDASKVYAKVKEENDEMLTKMSCTYTLTYSAGFNIPHDIWKAVKDEVRKVEREEKEKERERGGFRGARGGGGQSDSKGKGKESEDAQESDAPARMKILERGGTSVVSVHVNGGGRPSVARIKGAIQKLLKGRIICDDEGKPLWDAALRGPEGRKLVQLVMESGVHVHVDYRNRTVTIYGSADTSAAAEEVLKEQYGLLMRMQHELSLEGNRVAFRGGIAAVQEYLGEDMVVVNHASQKIFVRCSPADLNYVRGLLFKTNTPRRVAAASGPAGTQMGEEDACPVCMEPAEAPVVKTSCEHTYCKSCIQGYIKAAIDGRRFPINCFHTTDDGKDCATPLSISIIQDTLSKSDTDQLFELAFSSYVQARPNEYSYCPTPDCPTVYAITAAESTITCNQCFLGICTACRTAAHHGQSCAHYKAATSAEKTYQEWKAKNGVKTCPKCRADIEKNGGCNHMTCAKCKAHLCWHCMKEFDIGTIYNHMSTECGGTYDEDAREIANQPPRVQPPAPPLPQLPEAGLRVPTPAPPARPYLPADIRPMFMDHQEWLTRQEEEYNRLAREARAQRFQGGFEQRGRQELLAERRQELAERERRRELAERVVRQELAERERERTNIRLMEMRRRVEAAEAARRRQQEEARKREEAASSKKSGGFCVVM